MADRCPLCNRPVDSPSKFCDLHDAAFRNLESAYPVWNKGYDGRLTREDYITRVLSLPETGRVVKEVIQQLRTKGTVA